MAGAYMAQALSCNGLPLTDVKTELTTYEQNWIEGFKLFQDMHDANVISPDSFSTDFPGSGYAWGVGSAVTIQMGQMVSGMLGNNTQFLNPSQVYGATYPAGPHGTPQWQAVISGMYITSTSEHPDEAFDFIKYLASKSNQGRMCAGPGGFAPTRNDVTSAYLQELGAQGWWKSMWINAYAGKLYTQKVDGKLEPNYHIFQQYITKVCNGQLTATEAFQQFKAALLQAIG